MWVNHTFLSSGSGAFEKKKNRKKTVVMDVENLTLRLSKKSGDNSRKNVPIEMKVEKISKFHRFNPSTKKCKGTLNSKQLSVL